MRFATPRFRAALIGLLLAVASTTPAFADDSEVFTSTAYLTQNAVRPNILFIIDTSGSMDTAEANYNPAITYTGPCTSGVVYWRSGNSSVPPECPSTQYIDAAANRCKASKSKLSSVGVFVSNIQQFNVNTKNVTKNTWQNLTAGLNALLVECSDDDKVQGPDDGSSLTRANNVSGGWTASGKNSTSISWTRKTHTLYTGNYANWYYGDDVGSRLTRLDIVRDAAKDLTDTLTGVNLGLMRYDPNADGGMITVPVGELTTTQRTTIKSALDTYKADGFTPLSETLYEAGLYFAGLPPDFGATSTPPSVSTSIDGGNYISPEKYSCQKNYIVYLTDGLPTEDVGADSKIPAFAPPGKTDSHGVSNNFATVMGRTKCSATPNPDNAWKGHGECLDDMAEYLNKVDMRGDLYGVQNVTTFMIGFGSDVATSQAYLDNVALVGGSEHSYEASNSASLATTLEEIFAKVADDANLTFTSPTVSVNAFNRARNLNDLYVSVFSPSEHLHWDGNLKKYSLVNDQIYSVDPADSTKLVPAVNPETGFFFEDAKSFWSTTVDGLDVTKGGAANLIPAYDETTTGRALYTYLGTKSQLKDSANLIKYGNTTLTNTLLGLSGSDTTGRTNVIAFARGQDVTDINNNKVTAEKSNQMGDPMHARPAVVIYGGTKASPDVNDAIAYVPTNDGYLHAVNTKTGVERWAFVPREMLKRLKDRYNNPITAPDRTYGLDGDVRVFKYDVNKDGIVTSGDGDRVYLYFGFGRGGSYYYALDVTAPDDPQFLWKKTTTTLEGLGDAWSTPALARVDIKGGTQSTGKYVLIFGGGYDKNGQEGYGYSKDSVGNRVYMVDYLTGNLLWSAGPEGSTATLPLKSMTHSIPADITVLDVDGDGFADRFYAGDMGGRVWRFDIANNSDDPLVAGGVFATLGAADQTTPVREDVRRFYYAPDVALISQRGARPYYNLAIGSGYRGHPLEEDTHDRFYSLRDYQPYTRLKKADFEDSKRPVIADGDLVDVTASANAVVAEGKPGWKLELKTTDSKWLGEKVLAEAITVGGVILFPTFQPNGQNPTNPCLPSTLNRVYSVYADNARPFADNNHDGDLLDVADRATTLKQGGIAAGISVIVNNNSDTPPPCKKGDAGCVCDKNGENCGSQLPPPVCLAGVEVLKTCVPVGGTVRTFWQRK